jgi:hypothetical protein
LSLELDDYFGRIGYFLEHGQHLLQSNGYGGDDDERFMKFIASQMALGGFFQSNSFKFDIKSTERLKLIKFTAKLV